MESRIIAPILVNFDTEHTDASGRLIVKLRNRTADDALAFSNLNLDSLWANLSEYEAWRIHYCETNRITPLQSSLREGILDANTIIYSAKLRMREVRNGTNRKPDN